MKCVCYIFVLCNANQDKNCLVIRIKTGPIKGLTDCFAYHNGGWVPGISRGLHCGQPAPRWTTPLCGSRKYPYSPHRRSLEIPRGREGLKAKLLEGQYEAKLEFPGGCRGAKQKTFRGGSMDIFWNYTLLANPRKPAMSPTRPGTRHPSH